MGDLVYLRMKHAHQKALAKGQVTKLSPKFYGPFPVMARFGHVAYQLQLPDCFQIHPMFHVSMLKGSVGTQIASPSLPSFLKDTDPNEEPVAIIDRWVIYKHGDPLTQVLVKWSRLHPNNNTWEYLTDLLKQFPCVA